VTVRKPWPLFVWLLVAAAGCGGTPQTPSTYETVADDPLRDTDAARRHDDRGVVLLDAGDLDGAEAAFKAALAADTFYGPAHCNLGVVYYRTGRYYLAARESDLAARLMPEQAIPLNNLALIYERTGRLDEAAATLQTARERQGGAMEVRANLARVWVRLGRTDPDTRDLLRAVFREDTRPEQVQWAFEALRSLGDAPPASQ